MISYPVNMSDGIRPSSAFTEKNSWLMKGVLLARLSLYQIPICILLYALENSFPILYKCSSVVYTLNPFTQINFESGSR